MPRIEYRPRSFSSGTLTVIRQANAILHEYGQQGYDLTLRQLYYQFVARDVFPQDRWWRLVEGTNRYVRAEEGEHGATKNAEPNYKWLGSIVNDARLAGEIDWLSISDRTRSARLPWASESPAAIIEGAALGFTLDKWATQPTWVEVWVEKDALVGVIERACRGLDVGYLSCRGYVSQSEMWRAARRFSEKINGGQHVHVLHLGDHDPSGIDMTRDIRARITEFLIGDGHYLYEGEQEEGFFTLERIALTWEQIEQYAPPPNPAKVTDSRSKGYMERYGHESWELDALEPTVMGELIERHVLAQRDHDAWQEVEGEEEEQRKVLTACSERWGEVVAFLDRGGE